METKGQQKKKKKEEQLKTNPRFRFARSTVKLLVGFY